MKKNTDELSSKIVLRIVSQAYSKLMVEHTVSVIFYKDKIWIRGFCKDDCVDFLLRNIQDK